MLKKILRAVFTLVGAIVGYDVFLLGRFLIGFLNLPIHYSPSHIEEIIIIVICALIFGLLFFGLAPTISRQSGKVADNIETDLQKLSTNDIVMGTLGLVIGLLIAYLIAPIYATIDRLLPILVIILNIFTYFLLGFLGVVIATRKGPDIKTAWMANRKVAGSGKPTRGKTHVMPKILDTSVIIDGRIADIMKTGFIEGNIVIPEFVLVELRHIADSSDSLKRNRGRKGLDILNKIQNEYGIEIYNTAKEKGLDEIPEVDVKLLKLAQNMNGKVVTNDFNLNKVAAIKGVEVLNINELANALKPVVLPGEDMVVFLVKEGKEHNQAVAYLDDGTMIVVDEGRKLIGKTISVVVTSVLQTSAGRMIFAAPEGQESKGK